MTPTPALGESQSDGREANRTQLRRILDSPKFQNAPVLRSFLEYIAEETLQGRGPQINEYSIATRVFGRREDFDPTSATIVRTQAYRLRKKLQEYYGAEGAGDPIVLEIPKGHYLPRFLAREAALNQPKTPIPRNAGRRWVVALLLIAALASTTGYLAGRRSERLAANAIPASPALARFWSGYASSGRPVVIGYTNPIFFITETGDLLRPDGLAAGNRGEQVPPGRARRSITNPLLSNYTGPLYYEDGFTGSGEVIAVLQLTQALSRTGVPFLVKRSRMVTLDDLRNNDVIFLGSQSAYQALDGIDLLDRFDFRRPESSPTLWRGKIVDVRNPSQYYELERDGGTQQLRTDFAVLAVVPGLMPGRKIVVMGGLTTSGTQGAAEFATSEHHLLDLFRNLDRAGSAPEFFEAVIRVEAAKGLDAMKSALVVVSPRKEAVTTAASPQPAR